MKQFSCGDVVAGCAARFVCSSEDELLAEVAAHARVDHGMTDIPDGLVGQVRSAIVTV
jgi:predicted small metal-binding protein